MGLFALTLVTVWYARPRGTGPGADEDRTVVLEGHRLPVQALAFAPDGATLTSAAFYFEASLTGVEVTDWDAATGQPAAQRTAPLKALRSLAFAPGGRPLAAAVDRQGVWLWDTVGSREPRRLGEHGSPVCSLALSGDGSQLATADLGGVVMLWDVAGGRRQACWKAHAEMVTSLAYAPGGRVLATGGADNTVRLWDVATGGEVGVWAGHARAVTAINLAFSPDGGILAASDSNGVVRLWDVAARTERATLAASPDKSIDVTVAFAPDGGTLAVAIERTVELWDVAGGRLVTRLAGHTGNVRCLAFSPDGTRLASGGHDRTVRLWNIAGYRPTPP
jgi:WD40 repeat protein